MLCRLSSFGYPVVRWIQSPLSYVWVTTAFCPARGHLPSVWLLDGLSEGWGNKSFDCLLFWLAYGMTVWVWGKLLVHLEFATVPLMHCCQVDSVWFADPQSPVSLCSEQMHNVCLFHLSQSWVFTDIYIHTHTYTHTHTYIYIYKIYLKYRSYLLPRLFKPTDTLQE